MVGIIGSLEAIHYNTEVNQIAVFLFIVSIKICPSMKKDRKIREKYIVKDF